MIFSASESTLDDLLHTTLTHLLTAGISIHPTKGPAKETFGAILELKNPRARLSVSAQRGRIFSAVGELLWYLSGTADKDQIVYYISHYAKSADPDAEIAQGAYGPKLFAYEGDNQVERVIATLKRKPDSRNAVIQIFNHHELESGLASCTSTLQFVIRDHRLNLMTTMRSNDAYFGLPHDIFCFTMLQELVARSLGIELGTYVHSVGSLHVYEEKIDPVRRYLDEGWQQSMEMPPMPPGSPWQHVERILELETRIRIAVDSKPKFRVDDLPTYWQDFSTLLTAYRAIKDDRLNELGAILVDLHQPFYKAYLLDKQSGQDEL